MLVFLLLALPVVCAADIPDGYTLVGTDVEINTFEYLGQHLPPVQTLADCASRCNEDSLCVALSYAPTGHCTRWYIRRCQTASVVPAPGNVVLDRNAPVTISPEYTIVSNASCVRYVHGNSIDSYDGQVRATFNLTYYYEMIDFQKGCKARCKQDKFCQSWTIDHQFDESHTNELLRCTLWSDSIYSGVRSKLAIEPCENHRLTYGLVYQETSKLNCGILE